MFPASPVELLEVFLLFKLTHISVLIFIAALVNIFTTTVSWQRRKAKGGVYFAFAMLAITFWTLAAGLDYSAVPVPLKVLFAKLEYLGYMSAVALFAAFSLSYAGYHDWLKKPLTQLLLIGIPVSNILLAWTNELHGWIWTDFVANETADNVLVFVHGPAFTWVALSGYLLILIIFVSLLQAAWKGTGLARRQASLLFFALLALIASNLLYLFDTFHIPGVDWSSVTFSITGFLFLSALYGSRFLDLVPVARNILIERMTDGVLVLDSQGQLVDFNPAAQTMFGLGPDDLWKPVQVALARWPEVIGPLLLGQPEKAVQEVILENASTVYDLRADLLEDNRGQVYGKLVVFREITERKQTEEILRQSEEKFYKAFHSDPDAILITRLDNGLILEVNEGFSRLFGYSRAEALAASTLQLGLWVHLSDRDEVVGVLQETGAVRERESLFQAKSGEKIIATYSGEIILLSGVKHVISTVHDLTQRKLAEQELQESQAQVAAQQQELARLEERQRMARDLHDSVSQSLHSLVLFSETLTVTIEKNNRERALHLVARLQESAQQSHKEMRLILFEIQAEDSGNLIQRLEARLAMVERRSGVQVRFDHASWLKEPPAVWSENLYWMATEALNNINKHALAHQVSLVLHQSDGCIELEVRDNGIGFEPARVAAGRRGLKNLRERAAILAGELTIASEPGRGTVVRFTGNPNKA
jgi:PAS domain S-box-containing protein